MGFFGNLFKKKEGGSVLGNLWRGVKDKVIGGGVRWVKGWFGGSKKKEEPKKPATPIYSSSSYQNGQKVGQILTDTVTDPLKLTSTYQGMEKDAKENWLKSNWGWLAGGAAALIGGTILITKNSNKNKR